MPQHSTRPHSRGPRKNLKKVIGTNGYVLRWVGKSHHLADSKGYAYAHRLVAEEKIGRRLEPGEVVHHKDHDKQNNDPDNLEVHAGHFEHNVEHRTVGFNRRLPGEENPLISCECGCGESFLKYDQNNRPRQYASGHNPSSTPSRDAILGLFKDDPNRVISTRDAMEVLGQGQNNASSSIHNMIRIGILSRVSRGRFAMRTNSHG